MPIDIFTRVPDIHVGVLKPPNWSFIKDGLKTNINIVENYYKDVCRPVKSNHFLVRLLQSITVPNSLPLDRYYSNVDAIALNLSMVFKMTSSIYKGNVHRGIFYGSSSAEILIANDESFNIFNADSNWKNMSAVRVLLHPKTDLGYIVPNGFDSSSEAGLSVILINIPMLAIQYRAFLNSQRHIADKKSIMQFIGGYVLPNMLKSQTEISIFNRVYNKAFDIKLNDNVKIKHPFFLQDYRPYLDKALDNCLDYISKSSKSYRTVFQSIPSVYNENIYYSLLVPDIAPTRQIDWALVASRLKMIQFLIRVSQNDLINRNQMQMTQILRSFRINNIYSIFKENLPIDVFYEVDEYVNNLLTAIKAKSF